jgi:hypothetical protein
MRLVSAVLFVALTGSAVLAEEAKPADPKPEVTKKKVPFRVVKMLPETGQVLLFDKHKGSHVVAEVGQALDGYTIDEIDDDEVTLTSETGASVILTAPPPPRASRRAAKKAPAPADPYAEPGEIDATSAAGAATPPAKAGSAPVDPYADPEPPAAAGEGGVRVASAGETSTTKLPSWADDETVPSHDETAPRTASAAPIVDAGPGELADPYGDPGIAAFVDAVGATPAPAPDAKPAKKPAKGSAKKTISADAAADLASTVTGSPTTATTPGTTLARAELDAALGDFGKLAQTFRAAFTTDGLRFDSIHEGSLLAKIGLRKGDVVTAVDGQPLRSIDDAAELYARSSAIKNTTLQVSRAGKPVTLRVAIL